MFYATNGWGLGHISRTLALARQIRARDPLAKFLFLTDSEAINIVWQEGFASVKMLPAEAVRRGFIDVDVKYTLNPAMATATFASFQPDVFIADTYPVGRTQELFGALPSFARSVLIYLEQPESLRGDFAANLRAYHLLLAPYEQSEVELPSPMRLPVEWTGYLLLRSRNEALPRPEARRRLGLPQDAFIVYVGFGGGGDTRYGDFLGWALRLAKRHPAWLFAVLVPPLAREPMPEFAAENIVTFSYFPLAEVFSAFDGAISALGVGTTAELLYFGVPTIFMPRPGLSDDHTGRASRIAARGAGLIAEALDVKSLDAAAEKLADTTVRADLSAAARNMVSRNGAEVAAEFLLDWVKKDLSPRFGPARPTPT